MDLETSNELQSDWSNGYSHGTTIAYSTPANRLHPFAN